VRGSPGAMVNARQQAIVQVVRQRGFATIEAMADDFGVSAQTIRRDIIRLSRENLLERYHGGAGLPTGRDRLAYTSRRVRNAAEKRACRHGAGQIPNARRCSSISAPPPSGGRAQTATGSPRITNHIGVVTLFANARISSQCRRHGAQPRSRPHRRGDVEFLGRFRVEFAYSASAPSTATAPARLRLPTSRCRATHGSGAQRSSSSTAASLRRRHDAPAHRPRSTPSSPTRRPPRHRRANGPHNDSLFTAPPRVGGRELLMKSRIFTNQ